MTKIYQVGNFDALIFPHKERKFKKVVNELGYDYKRLVSFWDIHRAPNIIELKQQLQEGRVTLKRRNHESRLEEFKRIHKESKNWPCE